MSTLITGATGFLGSMLARRLCARGEKVRALVRKTSNRRRIADLPLEIVEGDVTDRPSVEAALAGVTQVYHCAALYEFGTPSPTRMQQINVAGTANVLASAVERSIPATYVSSAVALGPTGPEPRDESHWTDDAPRSVYQATKREAHQVARRLMAGGGAIRVVLPVTIYGCDDPSPVGAFHRWYARHPLPIAALPEMKMSLVHVADCAAGLIAATDSGQDGQEYLLSAQVVTCREWITALSRLTKRRRPVYLPDWLLAASKPVAGRVGPLLGLPPSLISEGFAMSSDVHWAFSGAKAQQQLPWKVRPLEQGLAEVLSWYRREAEPAGLSD